jgi:hypothetical protein
LTPEKLVEIVNEAVAKQFENYFKKQEKEIKYISRKEAAKILGCTINTLDDWTLKKYLQKYWFGGTIRYIKHEVEEAGPSIIRRRKKGDNHA